MNRLERQDEERLTERVQRFRTMINDLRQAQNFGGSDIRFYSLSASPGPDMTFTNLTTSTAQGMLVTVTPLATNKVSVPTPIVDFSFAFNSNPGGANIWAPFTKHPPSGGVQTFEYWFVSGTGSTITSIDVYLTILTFVPATYTVTRL